MIKDFMVEQYAAGKKILLIIDEAQNLSRKVLEEVRLLSGLEAQKEKLLRIIIAGQPELSHKLDSPRLAAADAARSAALSSRRALQARNARVHHASAEHRRRERANDLRARGLRRRVPLRGRRAAPRQRLVRHGDAVRVRRGAYGHRRRRSSKPPSKSCSGSSIPNACTCKTGPSRRTGQFANAADRPMARLEVLYRDQLVGEYRHRSRARRSSGARPTTTCKFTAVSSRGITRRSYPTSRNPSSRT